ncbi:hypothetical protein TNCV_2867901 [Trichonephila clavipes]|nr:hypothetical protein TNCV_2867901 [Trichonephila clavipes]
MVKTYEDDCQQYQRKYRKQIPTRANIRLLVNKFRRIGSVADEKLPGRPLTSDDAFKRLYLNSLTSSFVVAVFEEMFSLEERIATISWKLDGKTYEDDCQQYQRKYRKQIPTGANIRLLVNKFRRIGSVADEKLPGRPLTSNDAFKRL